MEITVDASSHEEARQQAVSQIEERVERGEATKEEIYEIAVNTTMIVQQLQEVLTQVYLTLTMLGVCVGVLGVNLAYNAYTTQNVWVGIWAVFALLIAGLTISATPPGSLKAVFWNTYSRLYDRVTGLLP